MESKLTAQQLMDKFVQTYSDLYTDISQYSTQENIPLVIWLLGKDFKKVTTHELVMKDPNSNPFKEVKDIIIKDEPTAYVLGGIAVAVKKLVETGESTSNEINSRWTDDMPLGGIIGTDNAIADKNTYEDVVNDPNRFETIKIATSVIDLPSKVKHANDELTTIDNLTVYVINRTNDGVTLTVESESGIDKIGNSTIVNVQGKKFGLRRK